MKSKKLTSFATVALLAVLALLDTLFAQDKQDQEKVPTFQENQAR